MWKQVVGAGRFISEMQCKQARKYLRYFFALDHVWVFVGHILSHEKNNICSFKVNLQWQKKAYETFQKRNKKEQTQYEKKKLKIHGKTKWTQ